MTKCAEPCGSQEPHGRHVWLEKADWADNGLVQYTCEGHD